MSITALVPRCAAVGVATLTTLERYLDCLERLAIRATDPPIGVAAPRIGELLNAVDVGGGRAGPR